MIKKFAIYVRVSTKEQGDGLGKSPENQEHRCRSYINSQSEDPREERRALIFRDIGHSGKDLERPAFAEMMKAVERGEVHTIIFTELSRISRSVMDFLGLVERLNESGVNFISIKEQYNTSTAIGRLLMTMIMALNAFEREQVSERTRAAFLARSERGFWSGPVPLGYRQGEEKGFLVPVEEEASLVRHIYELYDRLGSISAVERALLEAGTMRPSFTNYCGEVRPPRPFRDTSIRRILSSPVYLGLRELNQKNRKLDQDALPEDERYRLVKGMWDPIIDEELAARVQRRLEFNRAHRGFKGVMKTHDFLLYRYLYCGECGAQLTRESAKGNRYSYYCHPTHGVSCERKRWRAEDVEATVLTQLLKLGEEETFNAMVQETEAARRAEAEGLPEEISALKARLEEAREQRALLLINLKTRSYAELPQSMLDEVGRLERLVDELEIELELLESQLASVKFSEREVRGTYERLKEVHSSLLNPERYPIHRSLKEVLHRVELRGARVTRALLLNTSKSPSLLDFSAQKKRKRPQSSSTTAVNLGLRDLNPRPSG